MVRFWLLLLLLHHHHHREANLPAKGPITYYRIGTSKGKSMITNTNGNTQNKSGLLTHEQKQQPLYNLRPKSLDNNVSHI